MKLTFPPGVNQFVDVDGKLYAPDAAGQVDIGPATPDRMRSFLNAGFTAVSTTATRPTTGLFAGLPYFDLTLGKPIWRNGANSGWVDATGAAV